MENGEGIGYNLSQASGLLAFSVTSVTSCSKWLSAFRIRLRSQGRVQTIGHSFGLESQHSQIERLGRGFVVRLRDRKVMQEVKSPLIFPAVVDVVDGEGPATGRYVVDAETAVLFG